MNAPAPSDAPGPIDDAWDACDEGALRRLRGTLRRREQGRRLRVAAGVGSVATAAVVALLVAAPGSPAVRAIGCGTCLARMPAYHASLTDGGLLAEGSSMPAEEAAEVRQHLDDCDKCRTHFEEIYPGVLAASVAALAPLAAISRRVARRRTTSRQTTRR